MAEKRTMIDRERIRKALRARTFIVCAVIAGLVLACGLFLINCDDSQQVDLSTVLEQVQSGKVWTAKVVDAERRIEITTVDKKRFHSYWSEHGNQGVALIDELTKAQLPGGYSVEVPKSWW
ncbi:ATP-dependent metallopeptidase FtsH/Yme1/Tma family protein [Streptosporangium sp. NPDC001559]|uniref:ATP-dependent metallopeptidase FtsH/Yme1/Tma family protein n=1 Tax=Streptosporangium sp. NPDC001559 TaxID=3366187 RepID=UPI0036E65CD8